MPPETGLQPSASYSRLEDDSDEDDNDVPLLSMQEALDNPEAGHHPHKSRYVFNTPHERTFAGLRNAIQRFYHLHKFAFMIYLLAILLAFVFIGLYVRSLFHPSNPHIIDLSPAYFPEFGSKRVRIKYGPYTVPPSSMADFRERQSIKPCEDCLITFMQAGLEYQDGSYANADSGIWLHHVVQVDTAVDDTVCGKEITKQRISPNRFFASGNERSPVHLSAQGTQKTGYHLSKPSTLITATELMNETPSNKTVILTIDYEFIPALPYPPSFRNLTSVWLDVGGCGHSDVPITQENKTFTLSTPQTWIMPATGLYRLNPGRIVFAEGHLHDAGTHIEIVHVRNNEEEEVICDSIATYGATSGFIEKEGGVEHISNMTSCGGDVPSKESNVVKAGDGFNLRANYDLNKRPGMREADGSLAPVMGIAILYIAPGDEGSS